MTTLKGARKVSGAHMRRQYDFSKMKGRRNPYAKLCKKAVTMRCAETYTESQARRFL